MTFPSSAGDELTPLKMQVARTNSSSLKGTTGVLAISAIVFVIANGSVAGIRTTPISNSTNQLEYCERVTIKVPSQSGSATRSDALQLANDNLALDPAYAQRLHQDIFEFRLSQSFAAQVSLDSLRGQGLLVNPVLESMSGQKYWYSDRIEVVFRPGVPDARRNYLHDSLGCLPLVSAPSSQIVAVVVARGRSAFEVASEYAKIPECSRATAETFVKPVLSIPDNARDYRDLQWPYDNRGQSGGAVDSDIDANYAWRLSTGSTSVTVAVIDCAFCPHPDTASPVSNVKFYDAVSGWSSDQVGLEVACGDCYGRFEVDSMLNCAHGNMVLGLMAAAHNNYGIHGLAPRCSYVGVKACNGLYVDPYAVVSNLIYADALRYIRDVLDAKIIVQSWDIYPDRGNPAWANPDSIFYTSLQIIDSLRKVNHSAFFVAAGNSGDTLYKKVIIGASDTLAFAVGATNHSDVRWAYSNFGPQLDFVAPAGSGGPDPETCALLGDEPTWDPDSSLGAAPHCDKEPSRCRNALDSSHVCGVAGTSFAAPKVGGVAALVLSYRPDLLDSADVGMALYNVLKASAEDKGAAGRDDFYGWGRVNAQRALALVSKRGDLNIDGVISVADIVHLVNQAHRGSTCTPLYGSISDLNCDSVLDIVDVVKLVDVAFRGVSEASAFSHCPSVYEAGLDTWCDPAVLLSPPDKASSMLQPITLEWDPPEYWVVSSLLEVDDSPQFDSPVYQGDASPGSKLLSGLDTGSTYYWRVQFFGSDCCTKPVIRSFTTYPSSPSQSTYENLVLVESKSFDCADDSGSIGVYLSNAVPLSGLVLPLEIRNISGEAYPSGFISFGTANRLSGNLTSYSPAPSYLPDEDATGSACGGSGFATRGDFEEFDEVSPDAVMFTGIAIDDTLMLEAGSDGEPGMGSPSLVLSFGLSHMQGTFEVDTTCISPANHLAYIDGSDTWNAVTIVPSFTKGVVTVNGIAELAGHVTGNDTAACHAIISGDVIVDSNASLTLLSDRTFTATAFTDAGEGGANQSLAEIIVFGELTIGTESGGSVVLTSDSGAAGAWYGVRVMPGGRLKILSDVVIENAVTGITIDTAVVSDTVRNCAISNCSYSGILTFNSSVPIINNSIFDVTDGEGILAIDCDPIIAGNFISGCETGISVIRSSGIVRDNLIAGTGGMYGVLVNQDDELYPGADTLKLIKDSVYGYFTQAHLQTSYKGHCSIDSCSFIAEYEQGAQSPISVKASQDAWVRMRNSRVRNFGGYGIYSYKSKADLGRTSSSGNNSIFSTGSVDTCEECLNLYYYVRHIQSTSTDTLKAENNWWAANPPSTARFNGLVDRAPCLSSEPLPKIALGNSEEVAVSRPGGFEIDQNYPNPFNPSTTISFSIPVSSHVSVTVYNVLGQQVDQVFAGELPAGSHRFVWDGSRASGTPVASGVYFYTVVAGTFSETRKMVVLK